MQPVTVWLGGKSLGGGCSSLLQSPRRIINRMPLFRAKVMRIHAHQAPGSVEICNKTLNTIIRLSSLISSSRGSRISGRRSREPGSPREHALTNCLTKPFVTPRIRTQDLGTLNPSSLSVSLIEKRTKQLLRLCAMPAAPPPYTIVRVSIRSEEAKNPLLDDPFAFQKAPSPKPSLPLRNAKNTAFD